jgi:hypothetical protein
MLTAANHLLQLTGLEDIDMKTNTKPIGAEQLVLDCLKEAYFRRVKAEKLGKTKQLTEEIDTLEHAIRYMKSKIPNETSTK